MNKGFEKWFDEEQIENSLFPRLMRRFNKSKDLLQEVWDFQRAKIGRLVASNSLLQSDIHLLENTLAKARQPVSDDVIGEIWDATINHASTGTSITSYEAEIRSILERK